MVNSFINIPGALSECASDLSSLPTISLDAQIRAYRLLDAMLADSMQSYKTEPTFTQAAEDYLSASGTSMSTSLMMKHLGKLLQVIGFWEIRNGNT